MNNIKALREGKGKQQKDLAIDLNVTQPTVSDWESGRKIPSAKNSAMLADYFGVSIDYLLGRTEYRADPGYTPLTPATPGAKWIPVLGKVAAGKPIEAITDIIDYEDIPAEMAKNGDYFALRIRGDSMEPKISDGDVVVVRKQPDVDSGQIAIVIVNGSDATCKKIMKYDRSIALVSLNPMYQPVYYTDEDVNTLPVTIIGRAVEIRAKLY